MIVYTVSNLVYDVVRGYRALVIWYAELMSWINGYMFKTQRQEGRTGCISSAKVCSKQTSEYNDRRLYSMMT
jgi:hypothetical protein